MSRVVEKRRRVRAVVVAVVVVVIAIGSWRLLRFPPDTTPEGAYMRVARAIREDAPENAFAYLEQDAQHACFTIVGYAGKARERIVAAYPEPERSEALARYEPLAATGDGPKLFAHIAKRAGFVDRLRRDLSGVASVTVEGDRATVVTARGTRYPFRRRPNGIWGLTLFTAELTQRAEHLARDWELIQSAAADYQRSGARQDAPTVEGGGAAH
ncbi:MAG: hypothetical protein RIF41_39575 [Polyangiaceae bacterium]